MEQYTFGSQSIEQSGSAIRACLCRSGAAISFLQPQRAHFGVQDSKSPRSVDGTVASLDGKQATLTGQIASCRAGSC